MVLGWIKMDCLAINKISKDSGFNKQPGGRNGNTDGQFITFFEDILHRLFEEYLSVLEKQHVSLKPYVSHNDD